MPNKLHSLVTVYRGGEGSSEFGQIQMLAEGLFLFTSKLQTAPMGVLRCYLL